MRKVGWRRLAAVAGTALTGAALAQTAAPPAAPPPGNIASSPDVNLTPRRVVFVGAGRGAKEITVFNRSNATATYSIALVDRVMTPDGALVELDALPAERRAALKSATAWVRYSPRQVTLGPNEAQTVRVQARRPADLPPGEYRTHFSVTAVPPQDAGLDVARAAGAVAANELSIRLTPVFGIMIPIIVRSDGLPVTAGISDVALEGAGDRRNVSFTITRSGDRSLYGGADVFLLGGGQPRRIAQIKGIGVYNEIASRRVSLPLAADAPPVPAGSRLRVVYTDDDHKPGAVLAQAEVALP